MPTSHCRCAPLPDLAVIVVEGTDAEAFLAAQLGRTPPRPDRSAAPLAAWHDAKGRVQGLFRTFRPAADVFWLTTPADAAPGIVADLSRFVLRSRVALRLDDGDIRCIALLGDCESLLTAHLESPTSDSPLLAARVGPGLSHLVGPASALAGVLASVQTVPANAAELAEIRLGIPRVDARLRGQFLPQMLDLDRLGAIEFDRGCYPGQEIIVRTQHRGTIKRQLTYLTGRHEPQEPVAGDAICNASGDRVGQVVRAARADDAIELLAVVELAALAEPLQLGGEPPRVLRQRARE